MTSSFFQTAVTLRTKEPIELIDLTEKIQRAVWAHIRHRYTDYDELMRSEMNEIADSTLGWNCEERQEEFDRKKGEIRGWVKDKIEKKLTGWEWRENNNESI